MTEIIVRGGDFFKVGCIDPLATNYDPTATQSCVDCCTYGSKQVIGCRDPLAVNYDSNASVDCDNCCIYENTTQIIASNDVFNGFIPIAAKDPTGPPESVCPGPFSITIDNEVLGVNSAQCCSATFLGPAPKGYEYYWDGRKCYISESCPINLTCVSCNNFDWWNDTYIVNHNGQSLQVSNPVLWQQIVDVVSNSGQTFYVETSTGNLINNICCVNAKGTFRNGICFCETPPQENYKPRCIATLNDFLDLISTLPGYNFWVSNSLIIGSALGLTNQQINFITANINSNSDSNNNGIQDKVEARLILSNALNITGGFYVSFGEVTNQPKALTKGICDSIKGYWYTTTSSSSGSGLGGVGIGTGTGNLGGSGSLETGPIETVELGGGFGNLGGGLGSGSLETGPIETVELGFLTFGRQSSGPGESIVIPGGTLTPVDASNGQCMCKPIVDQCDIDITQVEVVSTKDFYNNTIQIAQLIGNNTVGGGLTEACCNRLIKDYNLPWVWQGPWCYAAEREDCLPVVFSLNKEPMYITCENDLELSMWVYFGKPNSPCQPIPDPPGSDVIIIDGEVCDITLTPNTGALETGGLGIGTVDLGTSFSNRGAIQIAGVNPTEVVTPVATGTTTTCCYSNQNPILARITTTDPLLNSSLVQVKVYNSNVDYFDKWVEIKAKLPTSGLALTFGINLEIYQGLNCCCNYDIFVDDIEVNCAKSEPLIVVNGIQCPGFELTKVIDNKKSWVYNPGTPQVGISEYDNIERGDGTFAMLNGEGNINRTFAPSLDADIPWRYTDYFVQSSVLERHSNLVINSKELGLTFDMCADCPISGTTLACPSGYTLTISGTTNVCVKTVCPVICPEGYSLLEDGITCQKIDSVPATYNGLLYSGTTALTLCMSAITYGELGGVFYENITNLPWPITARTDGNYHTLGTLGDNTNTTVTVEQQVLNTLWGSGCPPTGATCNTRLNEVGIWTTAGPGLPGFEWIGFSSCVELPYSGTYSIGIAGDDWLRLKINGQTVLDLQGNGWHFLPWRVFPVDLNAGTNLIELEVQNISSTYSILGAEIYSADTSIISGITNSIDLEPYIVFSTKDKIGQPFDLGTTIGYSCPTGYALNTCSGYTCSIVYTTGGTVDCSSATTEIISASTVPTVTYLSLYDLENYKKTFQSFWIPFMEQFIPATTIWVAGERWCNEPCVIIDSCDYDFELTEAEVSIEPVPSGFFPQQGPRPVGNTSTLPVTITSTVSSSSTPSGGIPLSTPNLLPIQEVGLTTETVVLRLAGWDNVDLQQYRVSIGTNITTETEFVTL